MDKKIEELLKNGYFHMTAMQNLYGKDGIHGIMLEGVKAAIGENSNIDSEPEKTVCFSNGIDGVYETISRFLARNMEVNKMEKKEAFEALENELTNSVYFSLDLEPGKDFDTSKERNTYRRDMHSVPNLVVNPERVSLVTVGSSISAFDFLKFAYANYKDFYLKRENLQFIENENIAKYIDLLNEFMEEKVAEKDRQNVLHISPIVGQKISEKDLMSEREGQSLDDDSGEPEI